MDNELYDYPTSYIHCSYNSLQDIFFFFLERKMNML